MHPAGYIPCNECSGTGSPSTHYDYVRGNNHTQFCARCDGDGRVYVGKRAATVSTTGASAPQGD